MLAAKLPDIEAIAEDEYSLVLISSGVLDHDNFSALLRLIEESCFLARLSLCYCELPEHEEAWNQLAYSLRKNCKLKHLSAKKARIKQDELEVLLRELKMHPTLEVLDFTHVWFLDKYANVTDSGNIELFAQLVAKNVFITHLFFSHETVGQSENCSQEIYD